MYSKWIKDGTKKLGKSRSGLADYLTKALKLDPPMSRTTIYKIISGDREIRAEELEPASLYMEEPIPRASDLIFKSDQVSIEVMGDVVVGAWFDSDIIEKTPIRRTINIPADFEFPNAKHMAFVVKDDSMNAMKIFEDDIVVCVDFKDTKLKLANSMKVVIERKNSVGLIERSVRYVEVNGRNIEFKSLCTDRGYKSVVVNGGNSTGGEKVTVVGLLRRSIREL